SHRLRPQPIGVAGPFLQPRHMGFRIVPTDVHHRVIVLLVITGFRQDRCEPSSGSWFVASTNPANSPRVTGAIATAKGFSIVTLWRGRSPSPPAPSGEPIMNAPAGTTIISGAASKSRKQPPGANPRGAFSR